jgi:hypothetical protein
VDVVPDPADGNRRRLADALAELEAIPDGEPGAPVDTALLARDKDVVDIGDLLALDAPSPSDPKR